ncbi:7195_t:CDS:2 [Entrophospora sp. SA101]|nr:7195_t:CDS:2 [Entrophospora sp. SA101]
MSIQIISFNADEIINKSYYGPFATSWLVLSNEQFLPYCVGMKVQIEMSSSHSPSGAISEMFNKLNKKGKNYSGLSLMGFDNSNIIEELFFDGSLYHKLIGIGTIDGMELEKDFAPHFYGDNLKVAEFEDETP